MRLGLLAGLVLLTMGCASPVSGLWPPPTGAPARAIIVSVDTWHAVIGFPREEAREGSGVRGKGYADTPERREEPPGPRNETEFSASRLTPDASRLLFEEWSYAEQAWYLEGHHGLSGVLRALFWPTPGVVEVGTHGRPWSERTPDPPAEQFRFTLSEEGFLRLRQFLEGSRLSETPLRAGGGSVFYPAQRAYSVFHQCHQYAAHALRAAGLPVSPPWALTPTLFVAQLRRAERMAAHPGRDEGPPLPHR